MKTHFKIPKEVTEIVKKLESGGFEGYLVGGCVRDLFLNKTPKDWDVTTNATPEEIQGIFLDSFYENSFGTVGVKTESEDKTLKVIEITPYRVEGEYSNNRHPDTVTFSKNIEDDLKRRDFTINAIALREKNNETEIVDLFEGIKDLSKGIIKTVGNPTDRFKEDGLRILRAVRLSTELEFEIESETEKSIVLNADLLENISAERIRDEFSKIIASKEPMRGILTAKKVNILSHFLPELLEGVGCEQNKAHSFDVFEHLIRSLDHAAKKDFSFEIRLTALLHDIGKPATRRFSKEKNEYTFYGHEVVGARMTKKILERLKFSRETIETVVNLVRWHMFFSDTEMITLSAVRRMIANVGKEKIWDLMNVRVCDRIGTGRPKENPFRLRKYHAMIDEAMRDPISVSQLKISGTDLIEKLHIKPSPQMGQILLALLEEVLEDPTKNTEEYLESRALELSKLPKEELRELGDSGKKKKEIEDEKDLEEIRGKHRV